MFQELERENQLGKGFSEFAEKALVCQCQYHRATGSSVLCESTKAAQSEPSGEAQAARICHGPRQQVLGSKSTQGICPGGDSCSSQKGTWKVLQGGAHARFGRVGGCGVKQTEEGHFL